MLKKIIIPTFVAISFISSPVAFSAENSDAAAQHKQVETRKNHQRSQDDVEKNGVGSERTMKQKRDAANQGATEDKGGDVNKQERSMNTKPFRKAE